MDRTQMDQCIENCLRCAEACRRALADCLQRGGRHANAEHLRLLQDCAESCDLSASLMLRGSVFHAVHCALCAGICKACEESCREVGDLDACAEACRRCHDSCAAMGHKANQSARGSPAHVNA